MKSRMVDFCWRLCLYISLYVMLISISLVVLILIMFFRIKEYLELDHSDLSNDDLKMDYFAAGAFFRFPQSTFWYWILFVCQAWESLSGKHTFHNRREISMRRETSNISPFYLFEILSWSQSDLANEHALKSLWISPFIFSHLHARIDKCCPFFAGSMSPSLWPERVAWINQEKGSLAKRYNIMLKTLSCLSTESKTSIAIC